MLAGALSYAATALAISCSVAKAHSVTEPEQEFLRGNFAHAAQLYQEQIAKTPDDPALIAGLARVLLRQQKVADADTLVTTAIAKNKSSVALYTALGEVQYREGTPWLAADSAASAAKVDLCYARLHLLSARLYRLSSGYASAAKEVAIAHSLDPHDPDVRLRWLETQPIAARVTELEAYLAGDTGDDPKELADLRRYLEYLKKQEAEPHKSCRLVSDAAATEIPFALMMRDATHIRAFGLDVKLNDRNARLQIDTGAGGLLISRAVADRAHLARFTSGTVGGIGSGGEKASYTAYADTIKIGSLEFHDCEVEVVDARNVMNIDGLIGMDVLSNFLVTLDFPMRKLALGPLPKRPDESPAAKPMLETAQSQNSESDPDDVAAAKPPVPGGASSPSVPSKPARGPRDRYVAPEMKDWTRVYRVGHDLIVPTALNDSPPKPFILDTGAFATTISPTVARAVTKLHTENNIKVQGLSGEVDKLFTADNIEFRFANLRQKARDVVAFESPEVSKNTGLEIAGFIGANTLGQVTMAIDYRDGLVKFSYDANRGYKYPGQQ